MTRITILLLVAAAATTGCLRQETTHTLYLSPDGSVRWVVDEANVYSDEEDEGKRFEQEQAYIGPALLGAHRVARGLQAIGPDGLVRTTVIRDERPFHVITDAPYTRIDRALDRLFAEAGIKATVSLESADDRERLRIRLDFSQEVAERDTPVLSLVEDFENLRFALTSGEIVAGGGFDVQDRRVARISREWSAQAAKALEERTQIELVLAWERAR
jgi:hypothetical protein